jgi:predicted transcriptional regulator
MKINAELVLALRGKKSWSQDELAVVAGVNLRTIQRVEKEASASLQIFTPDLIMLGKTGRLVALLQREVLA